MKPGDDLHAAMWRAINDYAISIGGDPWRNKSSVHRQECVVAVERAVHQLFAAVPAGSPVQEAPATGMRPVRTIERRHTGYKVTWGIHHDCCSACLHPWDDPPDYPPCESTGAVQEPASRVCPECKGRGWHIGECHPQETCGICNGTGRVPRPTKGEAK